ncbi:hypothetical protein D3C78_878520 [compost metagenome]
MDNEVHGVSLQVLQVVNAILHTNQIVQRAHSPEVVRTEAPAHMIDWGMPEPTRILNIPDSVAAIHNSDDPISLKLASIMIVEVSVELKDFDKVTHVVFVHVAKAVYRVPRSLVIVFLAIAAILHSEHLTTLYSSLPEGLVGLIVGKTLQFTNGLYRSDDLERISEASG